MKSIANTSKKWLLLNHEPIVAALVLLAMIPVYNLVTQQDAVYRVSANQVTLNLVILWGLWGWYSEALGKQKQWSKRKSWGVFVLGMVVIMVALRLGGMESAFG